MSLDAPARRSALIGACCVFFAAVGFSAKSILIKLAYAWQVDAATLLALRMAFSLPFFLAMALWSRQTQKEVRMSQRDWLGVVSLGFIGYYLASYLDFLGLQYISASLERLTLFLYPTIVVVFSALLLKTTVTRWQIAALAISYAGILLVFMDNIEGEQANSQLMLGTTLVFASAVAYALYLIGSGEIVRRLGSVRFTAYAMTVACLVTFVQFALTHPLSALSLPFPVYSLSLLMAILSTVLPAVLMSEGLRRVGANQAALVGSVGPVITIFFAFMFLDEPISAIQLAGAALVLAGVTVITIKH